MHAAAPSCASLVSSRLPLPPAPPGLRPAFQPALERLGLQLRHPGSQDTDHEVLDTAGIPFFFKQWGGLRKKGAGDVLDGRVHEEFPYNLGA
ncbi:MAG: hypothetical protein JOZ63_09520 [Planctomycetaceae bacterium]|nr:hypothetical protein [Planctomycetaceae bacterium]